VSTDLRRAIESLFPDAEPISGEAPQELSFAGAYEEQPRLERAECIEGSVMRAIRVEGDPEVRFGGFLDGIQRVQMPHHRRGVPIVAGTIAAAIRVRRNRRFVAWGHRTPLVERRLYVPLEHLPKGASTVFEGFTVVDTSRATSDGSCVSRHPAAMRAVALACVRRDREALERQLAELWCAVSDEPLLMDGGVSGSETVAQSRCVVGVIKSHTTLFADDDTLDVILSLRRGERSSVFATRARQRSRVASWYLRMHDPRGHDAMFGLVRIEVAYTDDVVARANDVSRWVLAEASPFALPDARWDRMVYGIRDCEQFLRSIAS
jgi:hypothetical protein